MARATEVEQENAVTDASDGAPSFEGDIKSLFRERDRGAMLDFFDLWSFDDVKTDADAILAAVRGVDAVRRAVAEREGRSLRALGRQWDAAVERCTTLLPDEQRRH